MLPIPSLRFKPGRDSLRGRHRSTRPRRDRRHFRNRLYLDPRETDRPVEPDSQKQTMDQSRSFIHRISGPTCVLNVLPGVQAEQAHKSAGLKLPTERALSVFLVLAPPQMGEFPLHRDGGLPVPTYNSLSACELAKGARAGH